MELFQNNVVHLRRKEPMMEQEMSVVTSPLEVTPLPKRGRGRPRKVVETKHDKFVRLAESRISRLLDTLRIIGNLNSVNYEHSPEEVEAICRVLKSSVDETIKKLKEAAPYARKSEFKLYDVLHRVTS